MAKPFNLCGAGGLQFKYAKISSSVNNKVKKGVIFSTYSALIGESSAGGKYRTRFKQLVHWLGKDFDGLVSIMTSLQHTRDAPRFCLKLWRIDVLM